MAQHTPDQGEALATAAARVGEKLGRFYAALPEDEQRALRLALHQAGARASEAAEDVGGYFFACFPMFVRAAPAGVSKNAAFPPGQFPSGNPAQAPGRSNPNESRPS